MYVQYVLECGRYCCLGLAITGGPEAIKKKNSTIAVAAAITVQATITVVTIIVDEMLS